MCYSHKINQRLNYKLLEIMKWKSNDEWQKLYVNNKLTKLKWINYAYNNYTKCMIKIFWL